MRCAFSTSNWYRNIWQRCDVPRSLTTNTFIKCKSFRKCKNRFVWGLIFGSTCRQPLGRQTTQIGSMIESAMGLLWAMCSSRQWRFFLHNHEAVLCCIYVLAYIRRILVIGYINQSTSVLMFTVVANDVVLYSPYINWLLTCLNFSICLVMDETVNSQVYISTWIFILNVLLLHRGVQRFYKYFWGEQCPGVRILRKIRPRLGAKTIFGRGEKRREHQSTRLWSNAVTVENTPRCTAQCLPTINFYNSEKSGSQAGIDLASSSMSSIPLML